MTNNPFLNALLASGYIVVLVSIISSVPQPDGGQDTILMPMVMLSLFVLSAAVMGYLFLYKPGQLYFEGRKEEAVKLFLSTVGIFAGITLVLVLALFLVPKGFLNVL